MTEPNILLLTFLIFKAKKLKGLSLGLVYQQLCEKCLNILWTTVLKVNLIIFVCFAGDTEGINSVTYTLLLGHK